MLYSKLNRVGLKTLLKRENVYAVERKHLSASIHRIC
jgi:hypothetical protein